MLTAVGFLTRLPVPAARSAPDLSRAAFFFPLVGALVGGIAAATRALADQALPPLPATLLAVTAALIVTGALHEDGLADVADALGAHTTRERRLEILKDPRVGAFGRARADRRRRPHHDHDRDPRHRGRRQGAGDLAHAQPLGDPAGLDRAEAGQARRFRLAAARQHAQPDRRDRHRRRDRHAAAKARPHCSRAALATVATGLVLHTTLGGITGDGYGATAKLAELASADDPRSPMDLTGRGSACPK